MNRQKIKGHIFRIEQIPLFIYLVKWMIIASLLGFLVGSVSAFFLISLDWVTDWRESHIWIIAFLPVGGLIIGLTYHYLGSSVVGGNNQLLEEFHSPKKIIPFRMAPLILFSTIATHFFGGSAGREGTAVQMGGAIADQFTRIFKLKNRDRKIILVMGVSAGFAAVFGTPLAGAVFALEVFILGRIRYDAIVPSFLAAVLADYACRAWNVEHLNINIDFIPAMTPLNFGWAVFAGILFGLTALLFSKSSHFWGSLFRLKIKYAPFRPMIGGIFIAAAIFLAGTTRYIGLGIPVIVESFQTEINSYDFLLKLLFTTFTLGSGFKGGEVTPLFFIGAALGNALVWIVPLPLGLMAGMGFVAVFAAATNTPIACTLMGMELFGAECGVYIGIACVVAYLFSGHSGIYSSQIIGSPKHLLFGRYKSRTLNQLKIK